jgi:hypothetical protein
MTDSERLLYHRLHPLKLLAAGLLLILFGWLHGALFVSVRTPCRDGLCPCRVGHGGTDGARRREGL